MSEKRFVDLANEFVGWALYRHVAYGYQGPFSEDFEIAWEDFAEERYPGHIFSEFHMSKTKEQLFGRVMREFSDRIEGKRSLGAKVAKGFEKVPA